MIKFGLLILLVVAAVLPSEAQQERKFIREGNELFEKQDFEKAEVEYRKAADKKNESFEAAFNMADALYKQKKYDEALQQFSALAKQETDKQRLGEIYHNIGNTLLSMDKTEESIEAYKESLRNRPGSEETKYNLEFARHKQQQDNKDQNKDQNQDQNKDQQNKDQNKDQQDQNKDQQDQNKDQKDQDQQNKEQNQNQQDQNKDQKDQKKDQQNKDQKDQDQKGQQPQEGKISKEDAERLLEALQNDEKGVQEKVQKQKAQEQKAKKMKIDKNW